LTAVLFTCEQSFFLDPLKEVAICLQASAFVMCSIIIFQMAVKGNKMPLTDLFYNRTPRHAAARRGERGRIISDSEGRIVEAVHQRVDVLARLAHGAVVAVEAGVVGQAGGVEDER